MSRMITQPARTPSVAAAFAATTMSPLAAAICFALGAKWKKSGSE